MLTSVCPQATKTCRSKIKSKHFVFISLKETKKPNSDKVRHHVVGMTGFEPATPRTPCVCATRLRHIPKQTELLSGWQDSNLRPPAPKAGAMTGLRYTPRTSNKRRFFNAERPRLELGEHLRVHRLAICCITTLPPLLS